MKTVSEIEELIRALKYYRNKPCECSKIGPIHSFQCVAGGRMMDAQIDGLLWVLGKAPLMDRLLEDFRSE